MKNFFASTCLATALAAIGMVPMGASANLLNNAGFEDPLGFDFADITNWNGFFGGPAGTILAASNELGAPAFAGNQALFLRISGNQNAAAGPITNGHNSFTGHVQRAGGVVAGELYELSVWALEVSNAGNVAEYRIEWLDAGGAEISRVNMVLDSLTGSYEQYSFQATAPAGATQAGIVFAVQSFDNDGSDANIQVVLDNASFDVVPEPASAALLALGGLAALRRRVA
ncbi:PEP-CTERM sorting domain-containing protein [Mucisphaera sp.]|uniref:PEP-CTERM sorting domain-containing protein n=1 Tax=Mucisphaera sp. TaxID=2913024 RepID=UPI003D105644